VSTQTILTVVGYAVGSYFGYPQLGAVVGSLVGGAITASEGFDVPKVSDLKAPQVQYGAKLLRLYGSNRTSGSLAWYSEKRVVPGDSGGKGDPSPPTADTAEIDVLYILSVDSPVIAITRVWRNGELIWTALAGSSVASVEAGAATEAWADIRFLDGNSAQLPDPTIEASEGVGNAPAYRHRQCVLIESLQLGQSGQMPLIEFECITSGTLALLQADGLLNHFDALTGAQVLSAIGPNLTITGGAGLASTTPTPRFGAARGNGPSSGAYGYSATGVTGALNRSWRAEGWFYPLANDCAYFRLGDGTYPTMTLQGSFFGDAAFFSEFVDNFGAGSGRYGDASHKAPLNAWSHLGLQYSAVTGELNAFINGVTAGRINAQGPGDFFGSTVFATIQVGGNQCISDEFYFHFLASEGDLYPDLYIVPTAPFDGSQPAVWTPGTEDLAAIVSAEWARVEDAARIDVTALSGIPVRGFQTSGSVRGSFEALAPVFHFGAVCSDKLYMRLQGAASVATLAYADLAAGEGQAADEPFAPERANDEEIPERVVLTYPNYADDYANGTETGNRGIGASTIVNTMQSNVVMSPAEAKAVAETYAAQAGIAATTGQVALTHYHAALEPTDPITVPDQDGTLYRMRIVRETYGAGVKTIDLVRDDVTALVSPGITSTDYTQSLTVAAPADTEIVLLDVPIWRDADNDPGFYAVAKGSSRGSTLFDSPDNVNFTSAATFTTQSVFGICTTTLGNWTGGRVFDEMSSVTVYVGSGTLASSTRDAMLADQSVNACAIGIDGRWEMCQFRTATLVSAGLYTLSGFLRGSRGAEWASTGHASGEKFVMATTAARRIARQVSEIGVVEYYKGVSAGRLLSTATAQAFTDHAVGDKPFAVVDLRAAHSDADVTLTWNRRTRLSTRFASSSGISCPLGETTESYDVELYDAGDALVSTDTVSAPSWAGSSAVVSGGIVAPVWGIETIGAELVAIRDDQLGTYTTAKSIARFHTSGAQIDASTTVGHEVYQWAHNVDELYVATADFNSGTPVTYNNSKVQRITRTSLGTVAATYTAGTPGDIQGVASDGTSIWITERYSGNLRKLNESTLASVAAYSVNVGICALYHVAGALWIVSNNTNEVVKWDIGTTAEVLRFSVVSSPFDLHVAGGLVFVQGATAVGVYNATTGAFISSVALSPPTQLAQRSLREFGSYVAVAGLTSVTLLDTATGAFVRTINPGTTYFFNVAGVYGSTLYLTTGAPAISAQTVGYVLTAADLTGYSVTVYQNSAVIGRGYPTTLSL
jgi:Putative phage tail protein